MISTVKQLTKSMFVINLTLKIYAHYINDKYISMFNKEPILYV